MKKISFLAVILLLSVSAFAILPPGNIQAAFKKMYPKANGIAWSQDDGYYCANFVMNGFTKNVWFNTQAQWQMTPDGPCQSRPGDTYRIQCLCIRSLCQLGSK